MSDAFQYRPKFVDIRVRPPTADEEEAAKRAEDVLRLKPGEKPCEWPGCRKAGDGQGAQVPRPARRVLPVLPAPRGRVQPQLGLLRRHERGRVRSAGTRRPTRPPADLAVPRLPLVAAKPPRAAQQGPRTAFVDPFTIFGARTRAKHEPEVVARAPLGKIERQALADLDLEDEATGAEIRVRYTELVKRCHPDANGGDRSTEHKLQRVIAAYKTLRKAGLA